MRDGLQYNDAEYDVDIDEEKVNILPDEEKVNVLPDEGKVNTLPDEEKVNILRDEEKAESSCSSSFLLIDRSEESTKIQDTRSEELSITKTSNCYYQDLKNFVSTSLAVMPGVYMAKEPVESINHIDTVESPDQFKADVKSDEKCNEESDTADEKELSFKLDLVACSSEKKGLKSSSKLKADEEHRAERHMKHLLDRLPDLRAHFILHKKIGEGTFSSVFLASLKPESAKEYPQLVDGQFAIKHITPIILPKRISSELKYMRVIGGKDNVVSVKLCLHKEDTVIFIMPYLSHKRFSNKWLLLLDDHVERTVIVVGDGTATIKCDCPGEGSVTEALSEIKDYVLDLNSEETREYMKNLMIALRRVHSFNVIHRDVKPSNFLYNRETKEYLLVDFGLSQRILQEVNTQDSKSKKRKRSDDTFIEFQNKLPVTPPQAPAAAPLKDENRSRRPVLQPRSSNNKLQETQQVTQPSKRQRLNESYVSENKTPSESKRILHTPKSGIRRSTPASHNFKLPMSSPKIPNGDLSIKKKLIFVANNENDVPNLQNSTRAARLHLSSPPATPSRHVHTSVQALLTPRCPLVQTQASSETFHESPQSVKQKFQTLTPNQDSDSSVGSTFVRVQNSQVKSHTLKPLSPLESEQQRKRLFGKLRTSQLYLSGSLGVSCKCHGKPQVCGVCEQPHGRPAPRAGTPGFRSPEVLLKYHKQTTAVDMWAAGVMLLCILSGCYPFFRSPDDVTALAEIMTVFGTKNVKNVAKLLGRVVQCNHNRPTLDLRKLCERLRRRRKERRQGVPDPTATLPICPDCENSIESENEPLGCLCLSKSQGKSVSSQFPLSAYDLLERLLDLNPYTRITAEQALQHPYLTGE